MLIKALKGPKKAILRQFLRTDSRNVVAEIFFKDFQDVIWIQNMFKWIRGINHTDSRVIWTRIYEHIDHFGKRSAPPLKRKIPYCMNM